MPRKKNHPIKRDSTKIDSIPDKKTLVTLTGFLGEGINKPIISEDDVDVVDDFPIVTLICIKLDMVIRLHFNQGKIENESILLENKDANIGVEAQKNQIIAALKLGFKRIELVAYGCGFDLNSPDDGIFNGFITWAKFGYTMCEDDSNNFIKSMKEKNRLERCISEIIFDSDFEEYWTIEGDAWNGEFELDEASINYRLFYIYYDRRFLSNHMKTLLNNRRFLLN